MENTATRNPNLDLQTTASAEAWLAPIQQRISQDDPELYGVRSDWWWTGQKPEPNTCPGVNDAGVLSSLPQPNLSTFTRQQVLDYFDNSWALTETLFSALQGEAAFLLPPYHQLRHPLIFYYCHPAVLYVNKLRLAGLLGEPIKPFYEQLFETGVDEMSWDDLSKNEMTWPSVREVNAYRRTVYQQVRRLIEEHPDLADGHAPITMRHPLWALFMGFEHERIHLETSSVLMREMPVTLLRHPEPWPADHASVPAKDVFQPQAGRDFPSNEWRKLSAGEVVLGKPRDWPSYGWDNEYGQSVTRNVRPFTATQFQVTNGEFHEFVTSGGYREEKYWTEEGWKWRRFRNAKWPTYWVTDGPQNLHQYKLRTLFHIVPMPWSWPVEVNFHEAKAYCAWRAEQAGENVPYRLITEGEHQRMRQATMRGDARDPKCDPVMNASGHEMMERYGFNMNLACGSPSPVNALSSGSDFQDVFGNVWEWCEDDFHPLEGFQVHDLYDDFSTPCFDGQHNMILGGSFISTGDEASLWSRFHFRPHFFQHAGFRMARNTDGNPACDAIRLSENRKHHSNTYESSKILSEYLLLHYGSAEDNMPYGFGPKDALNFPQRCAQLLTEWCRKQGVRTERVVDIGCAVGGAAFELARAFEDVVALDLSRSFIETAQQLQKEGILPFMRRDEGELAEKVVAAIDTGIDRQRVRFRQADACALPPELVDYDAVLLANLLCRLPSPKACLGRLGGPRGLVRPGGLAVIVSPYTWMEEYTPREVWLGGFEKNGQPVRARETLCQIMGEDFELLHEADMPLVIREHARKFQYIVSHAMIWQRRTS